jgi:selenocysteine lyase/cysteine desulfurase
MNIAEVQRWWDASPGWLDTASYGMPPRPAWEAVQAAMAEWRVGARQIKHWHEDVDRAVDRAVSAYARLVGVPVAGVAIGATTSQMMAPLAASLPDGARVLAPDREYPSLLYPCLVQAGRGVSVRTTPLAELAAAVDAGTDLVAFSLVQSVDGSVADYRRIVAAARAHGAMVAVDAAQACGWLPFDAGLADLVITSSFKWLMAPRGATLAYVSPAARERMAPHTAGSWVSGPTSYGPPLKLYDDARAFSISPSWPAFVGAAPALELVERIGVATIHDHDVALANRFLAGLGRPPGDSAIVTVDLPGAAEKLVAAGVRVTVRRELVRLSFHVYNTEADVDAALAALVGVRAW